MKKTISLILAIVTFITSIVFLVLFCRSQQINTEINSPNNISKMETAKQTNETFEKTVSELINLYDSDNITKESLQEIKDSSKKIDNLKDLSKTIGELLPLSFPTGLTSHSTITATLHNETIELLTKWQKDTIDMATTILNAEDLESIFAQEKESLYDSSYKSEINENISSLQNTFGYTTDKCFENIKIANMSDEYLISFIGYLVIFIISLLIFFICKEEKRTLLIIITVSIITIFTAFTIYNIIVEMNTSYESDSKTEQSTTEENQNENNIIIENTTVIPISNWGFNNLYELGYGLVEITGYNLEENYVYYANKYEGNIFKLENGYYISQTINKTNKTLNNGYTTTYQVVNNDSILLPGDGTFSIDNRKTIDDFIVFVSENDGYLIQNYVPFSLIDWDKGIDTYSDDTNENYEYSYKLYLK